MLRRAMSKGFTLAVRTKRTFGFVILFTLLIVLSIYTLNSMHIYETDTLLNVRGTVIIPNDRITKANWEDSDLYSALNEIKDYARGIYLVYGLTMEIGETNIGFIWIESFDKTHVLESELPWIVDEVKPTKIVEGRSLDFKSETEGIVGKSFNLTFALGADMNISIASKVGSEIYIYYSKNQHLTLSIVGATGVDFSDFAKVLEEKSGSRVLPSSIVFTTEFFVDSLENNVLRDYESREYLLRVIITAKGEISPLTLFSFGSEIDKNKEKIESTLIDYGEKKEVGGATYTGKQLTNALLISIISSLLALFIAIGYAAMLVSFRRFDIATLRAIGWSSKHIFMLVFGEFMLSILGGTILGMIGAWGLFVVSSTPLASWVFMFSGGIALISLIVGLWIINRNVLKIPPMEAFRAQ